MLAFPTPQGKARVADIDEKALYQRCALLFRARGQALPARAGSDCQCARRAVHRKAKIIDLTSRLAADGRLEWDVPAGDWTILRFGRTSTGQGTRPAPVPGLGFETDKFDPARHRCPFRGIHRQAAQGDRAASRLLATG